MDGGQAIALPIPLHTRRDAISVPWKSGDMLIRLETLVRVDGQYFRAHWLSMLPWDQAITDTLRDVNEDM
jgi:hypothetical protein